MKLKILLSASLSAILISCSGQNTLQNDNPIQSGVVAVSGDTVNELGKNIMVVYQDKKNRYWFGSWETGVYRFDGKTLIHYTSKHGLPNRIDEIKEDDSGNVYFNSSSPSSTIIKFDGQTFTQLKKTVSNEWKSQPGYTWFKDPEMGKVYRFDGKVLHELTFPAHPKFSDPFEVYSIYLDEKQNVWFGTNPVGVCRYNGKRFDWISENDVTELHAGPANGVRSILQDKNGSFWFNTAFCYKVHNNKSGKKIVYKRQESIGSLDGKKNGNLTEYLSSLRDNDDNLWFVTYLNGVWKYDGAKVVHYPVEINAKQIALFSIYKDNNGDLWLGTHENGVFKFNGQAFEQFKP